MRTGEPARYRLWFRVDGVPGPVALTDQPDSVVLAVADVDGISLDEDAVWPRHAARAGIAIRPVAALTRVFPAARVESREEGGADTAPDQSLLPALARVIVALSNR